MRSDGDSGIKNVVDTVYSPPACTGCGESQVTVLAGVAVVFSHVRCRYFCPPSTSENFAPAPSATHRELSSSWYYPGGCAPSMIFPCDYEVECDENARCYNVCESERWDGECVCNDGFEGDGETCEPSTGTFFPVPTPPLSPPCFIVVPRSSLHHDVQLVSLLPLSVVQHEDTSPSSELIWPPSETAPSSRVG